MSRFAPLFGGVIVLLVGVSVVILANDYAQIPTAVVGTSSNASSSLSVLPNIPTPTISVPKLALQSNTTVSTTTKVSTKSPAPLKVTKVTKISTTAVPASVVTPAPTTSSGTVPLDTVADTLRNALVNIICYAPAGSNIHSISGSGVVVDSKGIILTNAHVAQYFLLADKNVSCTIRTGSPAADSYEAAPIYISPAWIHANAAVLTEANPVGTGEYDFGLLAITKSVKNSPLPATFPFITLAQLPPAGGAPVVIASYGAQFLEANQIQSALYPTVVFGSIKDIFTFATNSIDVLALGGSAAAQEGSSGGGVADTSGQLVGTITTSTVDGTTDTRALDAISAFYIRAEYAREMGAPLSDLLNESVTNSVNDFAPQVQTLESILTAQLH